MPRPQRELDPGGGPLVEFARELRALRAAAGDPKFATMSRRTHRSKTALADAASGRHLPRWETVEDYVRACDADPLPWRARWERARVEAMRGATPAGVDDGAEPPVADAALPDEQDGEAADADDVDADGTDGRGRDAPPRAVPLPAGEGSAAEPRTDPVPAPAPAPPPTRAGGPVAPDPAPPDPTALDPTAPDPTALGPTGSSSGDGQRRGGFGIGMIVGALLGAAVVAAIAVAVTATGRPPVTTQDLRVLEVQNKVAIGPDRLVEDSGPAYLSSVPIAYCAAPSRHCKVPGTEMGSGATIVANCQVQGQRMVNFNLTELESRSNPYRADSQIWYRASFPDGRSGYLSEVYVNGENRGGLGLPTCGPVVVAAGAGGG